MLLKLGLELELGTWDLGLGTWTVSDALFTRETVGIGLIITYVPRYWYKYTIAIYDISDHRHHPPTQ